MAGQPAAAIVGLLDGLVNEWLLRALVLLIFIAHLVLVLLAGIRRHRASGGWRVLLWLAYQLATWSAPSALGKLFLCSTSREEQVLAFWTPFLLMHLARPDNMSAYSLEDNVLAGRQMVDVPLQVLGTSYVLYKHIIIVGDAGTLLPASCIMFSLGIAKYVENSLALWLGNLGCIRSSIKRLRKTGASIKDDSGSWDDLDNEEALLVAHRVFYISKGAFADYSFGKKPQKRDGSTSTSSSKIFSHEWKEMRKVVEMELSLMYDIMYTKAAMVHTWIGYIICLASPPLTAVALLLFFFHSTDGQRRADVAITYILLIGTLLLDVGWLLRAVGSTWTYAFLKDKNLLRSSLLGRRWYGLRCFAVSLAPSGDPSNYRRWSGTVGQYNILHETTHDTTNLCSKILKLIGMDETGMEYQYLRGLEILPPVRDLLFEQIWKMLNPVVLKKEAEEKKKKEEEEKRPPLELVPDHGAGFRWHKVLDEALEFGPEFQEIVLIWHIATDIFLLCRLEKADMYTFEYVKAIEELSNYMMFLVVVRPSMLPGLKLSSLHDTTRDALKEIWGIPGTPSCMAREQELATILRNMWETQSIEDERNVILSEGTLYAELMLARLCSITSWKDVIHKFLTGSKSNQSKKQFEGLLQLSHPSDSKKRELTMQKMLELILDSWVRLLIYAAGNPMPSSSAVAVSSQRSCGCSLSMQAYIVVLSSNPVRIRIDKVVSLYTCPI